MSCPTITIIDPTWCIGNSLQYINTNFTNLSGGVCDNYSLIANLVSKITALSGIVTTLQNNNNQPAAIPAGTVAYYVSNKAPTGWILADGVIVPNGSGTVVSTDGTNTNANFASLHTTLGTNYGVTGQLPDLRGYFIRSYGTNTDATASGSFGAKQADAYKSHTHNVKVPMSIVTGDNYYTPYSSAGAGEKRNISVNGVASDSAGDTETRPKNIALLPCIKY